MTGTTHYLGGVLAGMTLVACATPDLTSLGGIATAVAAVTISSVGGILPDIDHNNSRASKKFRILNVLYSAVSGLGKFFKSDIFEHRGIMHTLFVPFILLLTYFVVNNPTADYLILAGMVGYLSHILLDGFNPTGVPLLSPFYNRKIRFLPKKICIKTNSGPELIVKVLLIVGVFVVSKPVASIFLSVASWNLSRLAEKFL